jgi:hypothetical protein
MAGIRSVGMSNSALRASERGSSALNTMNIRGTARRTGPRRYVAHNLTRSGQSTSPALHERVARLE